VSKPAVIPTDVCIKPDLTLLFTKVWLIKNRLFLVGALAPRPMCAKIYERLSKVYIVIVCLSIKSDLTLSPTEAWLIKNRLQLWTL